MVVCYQIKYLRTGEYVFYRKMSNELGACLWLNDVQFAEIICAWRIKRMDIFSEMNKLNRPLLELMQNKFKINK